MDGCSKVGGGTRLYSLYVWKGFFEKRDYEWINDWEKIGHVDTAAANS